MKKILILFIIFLLMLTNIIFAGDNEDKYKTDSTNPQVQIENSRG
ncbi:hypothetical protein [Marinitoga aeolica]|nr:hypothetical protein [Marinitoga aeolica]